MMRYTSSGAMGAPPYDSTRTLDTSVSTNRGWLIASQ